MFKTGDKAVVKGWGRLTVTVERTLPSGSVLTDRGLYRETSLYPVFLAPAPEDAEPTGEEFIQKLLDRERSRPEHIPWQRLKRLEKSLSKSKMDWDGHFNSGASVDRRFLKSVMKDVVLHTDSVSPEDGRALLESLKSGGGLDRLVPIRVYISSFHKCPTCKASVRSMSTNGKVLKLGGGPCPYPSGIPPVEWDLDVPSGRIAVANDLRHLFPTGDHGIGDEAGLAAASMTYASIGVSHAYVGNTNPGLYAVKDGSFKIANPPDDEVWDGKDMVPVKDVPEFDGVEVAGIGTRLWWYSICDWDEFVRRCEHFAMDPKIFGARPVDVPAGRYRFKHFLAATTQEGPKETVFTEIRRTGPAQADRDFLAEHMSMDVSANEFVQSQLAQYPTLYGIRTSEDDPEDESILPWSDMTEDQRTGSWCAVADQVLLGSGPPWHEKGFPMPSVRLPVPDDEPPPFRFRGNWGSLSLKFSALFLNDPSPSFAKLFFRVLESVISFGIRVHNPDSDEVKIARAGMRAAAARYLVLARLHPDVADQEYVSWLSEAGRSESWISSFVFSPSKAFPA
jgi:hypothetical protein